MLYTPILPEAASGTLEPRHVVVPLRVMCPHAELLLGRATALDEERAHGHVETEAGPFAIALGAPRRRARRGAADAARSRASPSTRSASRISPTRSTCATTSCASWRRAGGRSTRRSAAGTSHSSSSAPATRASRRSPSSPTSSATRCRYYPMLRGAPQRWVLVDAAPKILPEIPSGLGEYAARAARRRGIEIRIGTTLERSRRGPHAVRRRADRDEHARLDGRRAGRTRCSRSGACRSTSAGASSSTDSCASRAARTCGRSATARAVPNEATPGQTDPPTCQHALRQARRLAKNLHGRRRAIPLQDARPGGDARPLQGDRRGARRAPARLPGLVRHADVPPLPAAAALAEAPRRRRLDGRRSSSAATSPSCGMLGHPRRLGRRRVRSAPRAVAAAETCARTRATLARFGTAVPSRRCRRVEERDALSLGELPDSCHLRSGRSRRSWLARCSVTGRLVSPGRGGGRRMPAPGPRRRPRSPRAPLIRPRPREHVHRGSGPEDRCAARPARPSTRQRRSPIAHAPPGSLG